MKSDGTGSIVAGWALCWLLNIAQLGIGWLMLVSDEKLLPAGYILIRAIGFGAGGICSAHLAIAAAYRQIAHGERSSDCSGCNTRSQPGICWTSAQAVIFWSVIFRQRMQEQ